MLILRILSRPSVPREPDQPGQPGQPGPGPDRRGGAERLPSLHSVFHGPGLDLAPGRAGPTGQARTALRPRPARPRPQLGGPAMGPVRGVASAPAPTNTLCISKAATDARAAATAGVFYINLGGGRHGPLPGAGPRGRSDRIILRVACTAPAAPARPRPAPVHICLSCPTLLAWVWPCHSPSAVVPACPPLLASAPLLQQRRDTFPFPVCPGRLVWGRA